MSEGRAVRDMQVKVIKANEGDFVDEGTMLLEAECQHLFS
jgi:hypothetical protein